MGISMDPEFKYAFLEQEINGNAMIQIDHKTKRGYLAEKNIQSYIKNCRPGLKRLDFNQVRAIRLFSTRGFFQEGYTCYELMNKSLENGRRKTTLDTAEVERLIKSGLNHLTKMNMESGKFIYGYFACFHKEIQFYNMLRHASSICAMWSCRYLMR